jgi:hypothetical protein
MQMISGKNRARMFPPIWRKRNPNACTRQMCVVMRAGWAKAH